MPFPVFPLINFSQKYDVVVIGATASGVGAAIAAAREGKKVALLDELPTVGGMISNGVSNSDIGIGAIQGVQGFPDKPGIGWEKLSNGLFEEFRKKVVAHYSNDPKCDQGFRYEPKVAEQLLRELIGLETNIHVSLETKFLALIVKTNKITSVKLRVANINRKLLLALNGYVIDATDCGDVAANAECEYMIGRESKAQTGEIFAGVLYFNTTAAWNEGKYALLMTPDRKSTQEGDTRIQAYSYILTLQDYVTPAPNLLTSPPPGYNPANYDIGVPFSQTWAIRSGFMPHQKYELNVHPKGGDLQEVNYNYADGDRGGINTLQKNHALGYLYYIQHQLGLKNFGLAIDEYPDHQNFPYRLYIRESRRITGKYLFTEHDLFPFVITKAPNGNLSGIYKSFNGKVTKRPPLHSDSIGIVTYATDSHAVRKYPEYRENDPNILDKGEGEFFLPWLVGPANIPMGVLVPDSGPRNLLVSQAVSATHVGFGALRMELARMNMGQAAGCFASTAIDLQENNQTLYSPENIPEIKFTYGVQTKLLRAKQNALLHYYGDISTVPWANEAIQMLSLWEIFQGFDNYEFKPIAPINRAEFVKIVISTLEKFSANLPPLPTPRPYPGFSDVHPADWFFPYVTQRSNSGG